MLWLLVKQVRVFCSLLDQRFHTIFSIPPWKNDYLFEELDRVASCLVWVAMGSLSDFTWLVRSLFIYLFICVTQMILSCGLKVLRRSIFHKRNLEDFVYNYFLCGYCKSCEIFFICNSLNLIFFPAQIFFKTFLNIFLNIKISKRLV